MSNSVEKIEKTHNLTGNTTLITGGSRRIGVAICKTLARGGANVAVNYFNNESSQTK